MKFRGLHKHINIVKQYQQYCRGVHIFNDLVIDVFLCNNTIHIIVPCPELTKGDNIVALFVCNNNNYVTSKNYQVEIQEVFAKEIEHTVTEFNNISLSVAYLTGGILHPSIYNEFKTYVDNYSSDVEIYSFIWNPNKDFNIYTKPYNDGYGIYLGNCLRYCVKDKNIANKICEMIKNDLTCFMFGRYPIKQKKYD